MADLICFNFFCKNPAEYQCDCSAPQTFWCRYHLINHLEESSSDHLVETITKNINIAFEALPEHQINYSNKTHIEQPFQQNYEHPCECPYKPNNEHPTEYIYDHSSECPFNPLYEYHHKKQNRAIQSILDVINSQKLAINKIKNKLSDADNLNSTSFVHFVKTSLASMDQYSEILDEVNIWAECAATIDDIPLSLMEIMNIIDNISIQIQFLKKLKEALWIKKQVRSYWLERLSESLEKTDLLKSEINRKIQDVNDWCFQHKKSKDSLKSIDDKKIDFLSNELNLISEFLNGNFEPKHIFQIWDSELLIYGLEDGKLRFIALSLSKNDYLSYAKTVELPNNELFCLMGWESCTIDLKTLSIKKRFPISRGHNYHSALVYYENYVYVLSSSIETTFDKYDVISNKKSVLPCPFMCHVSRVLSCVYKNAILVWVEKAEKLYKFDPLIESYSDIPLKELYSKYIKMLLTWNMKAYIIDREYWVFESGIENEYIWNKISRFDRYYISKDDSLSSVDFTHFSIEEDNSLKIYQFDLYSKKIYERGSGLYGDTDI